MIFIGPELSNLNSHFVTNVIDSIGTNSDLIIDISNNRKKEDIFPLIEEHLKNNDEEYVLYSVKENEDFFFYIKKIFPSLKFVTFFSDDEWRHSNYNRYIALYSDFSIITGYKSHIEKYKSYGINNIYLLRWAANPNCFFKIHDIKKEYDVTFVGSVNKYRYEFVKYLYKHGVNIRVFGKGWNKYIRLRKIWGGYITNKELVTVINKSKININFLWNNAKRTNIKGRTFEIPACGSFQLSSQCEQSELEDVGLFDDKTIAVFSSKEEALEKIKFYLDNEKKREAICDSSYKLTINNHTWQKRFNDFFKYTHSVKSTISKLKRYRILVIVNKVMHNINQADVRMEIEFSFDVVHDMSEYTGVIKLKHDSDINNEFLYMMAFGLDVDSSDVIAGNFYINLGNESYWIRFRDRYIDANRKLLGMLPIDCFMYSGRYVHKYGYNLKKKTSGLVVSYLEYPSFSLKLPYLHKRVLKLFFCNHGSAVKSINHYLKNLKIVTALAVLLDKVWQKFYVEK